MSPISAPHSPDDYQPDSWTMTVLGGVALVLIPPALIVAVTLFV